MAHIPIDAIYRRSRLFAILLAAGICKAALAAQVFQSFGPFMLPSDGAGQLASRSYDIPVRTGEVLALRYQAPPEHCASLRLHVSVDGREKLISAPIAPHESTEYFELGPLSGGAHLVSLRGEGITGGCDTGRVTAWGGAGTIWTSSLVGDSNSNSDHAINLGDVLFESEFVNFAWGYQHGGLVISSDGGIYTYDLPASRLMALPSPPEDGTYRSHWLAAKFELHCRQIGQVPAAELNQARMLARSLVSAPNRTLLRKPAANDRGSVTLVAYVRDSNNSFRRMVLGQQGDEDAELQVPQAEELRRWLERTIDPIARTPAAVVVPTVQPQ